MHSQNADTSADNHSADTKKRKTNVDVWAYIRIIVVLALMVGAIYAIFLVMKKFLKVKEFLFMFCKQSFFVVQQINTLNGSLFLKAVGSGQRMSD